MALRQFASLEHTDDEKYDLSKGMGPLQITPETKVCFTCKQDLPIDAFRPEDRNRKRTQRCRRCVYDYRNAWKRANTDRFYANSPEGRRRHIEYVRAYRTRCAGMEKPGPTSLKECIRCGEVKPRSEFHKKSGSKEGVQSACRVCALSDRRLRVYGLSAAAFEQMWRDQEGKCVICEDILVPIGPDGCVIDHDHKTGKVRAILCKKCNLAIGYLLDNPRSCERAAAFLRKHEP